MFAACLRMLAMVITTGSCLVKHQDAIREFAVILLADACAPIHQPVQGRRLNGTGQKCRPRDNSSRPGPLLSGSRMARRNIRIGLEAPWIVACKTTRRL